MTRSPPRFFLFPVHKASVGTGACPGRCVTDPFFLFCAATVWVLYKNVSYVVMVTENLQPVASGHVNLRSSLSHFGDDDFTISK